MRSQQLQSRSESKKVQQNSQPSKPINNPLNYFVERGGKVFENENGWANYYIEGEIAYLENIYIYPDKRESQKGTSLLSVVEMQIKEIDNCKFLFGSISRTIGSENVEKMLIISLKRGFKFFSSDSNAIILRKEL